MGSSAAIRPPSPEAERLRTPGDLKRLMDERRAALARERAILMPGHIGAVPGKPLVEVFGYERRPPAEPTLGDRLVEAARTLPSPFSSAQLAVAVWRLYPVEFGLRGHEREFPDHNRVVACLSGDRGLVARRRLARVSAGKYRVREG